MSPEYDADVIIVGAGILGGLAALHLARKGRSVLLLEAGPRVSRETLVEQFRAAPDKSDTNVFFPELPYAPKSSGGRYSDAYIENTGPMRWVPSMLRIYGGTTIHWSGAFWRYIPNDFRLKSVYGVGRDWPISNDDLEPWYTLAEQITGTSGVDSDDQSGVTGKPFPPRSAPYPLPPEQWSTYTKSVADKFNSLGFHFIDEPHVRATRDYDGRPACVGHANCSPLCPTGAVYSGDMTVGAAEKAGARVLTNTVAYKLEKGPGNKIAAVHTMSPDRRSTRHTARYFILAGHAVENPKLLLLSDAANSSGQVGCNLMSHPSFIYEVLVKDPLWPGRGPVQQGSVNDRRDGPHRARHSAIRYSSNQRSANLPMTQRLIKLGVIGSELDDRILHDSARFVSITTGLEQLPVSSNRITLSKRKDALGLPTPSLYFDVDDYGRKASPQVQEDFVRFDKAFEVQTRLGDRSACRLAAHVEGSTIMGADPKDSVVDGECRTHDHPNLFIASTGVHTSSSVVNPTLTGAALSLRLADRIAREV